MRSPKLIVIFLYNRLFDPLVQANFWLYIEDLLKTHTSDFTIHVISYEDPRFPTTEEQQLLLNTWYSRGMRWTALPWHQGTSLKSKLTDILAGFNVLLALRRRGFRYIVSYGSIASAYSYMYGRILGMRLFIHTFEPHSEYSAESGVWKEKSLIFKTTNFLEKRSAFFAVAIASGTRFMEDRLKRDWCVRGRFFKIPSVANGEKFNFDHALRYSTRTELGLHPNQPLLFYPGKFGGLYYRTETALMYRWLLELEPRFHFLIVTPNSEDEVHTIFAEAGVPRSAYTIRRSDYQDIHRYFFAADFGVIAVPSSPSKKFVSNIKVGEYLCAGLPYLITRGVSEDHLVAVEKAVGVVVDDFSELSIKAAWPSIKRFLQMDADIRRAHCRAIGLDYRGFEKLNPLFRSAIYELTK